MNISTTLPILAAAGRFQLRFHSLHKECRCYAFDCDAAGRVRFYTYVVAE